MDNFCDSLSDCFSAEEVVLRDGDCCILEFYVNIEKRLLLYNLDKGEIQICFAWDVKEHGTKGAMAPHLDW